MADEFEKKHKAWLDMGQEVWETKFKDKTPDKDERSNGVRELTYIESVKRLKNKTSTKTGVFLYRDGKLSWWSNSTSSRECYPAIGGPLGGKSLSSDELDRESPYEMYNRGSRHIRGPSAIWISKALLVAPEEVSLTDKEQVVLDYLLTAGYSLHVARYMIVAGR